MDQRQVQEPWDHLNVIGLGQVGLRQVFAKLVCPKGDDGDTCKTATRTRGRLGFEFNIG